MKTKIMILLVLFVYSISLSGQAEKQPIKKKSPYIKFECGDTYDWGEVCFKDSPLQCTIKIFNDGSDTLKIHDVKPGCGCTTSELQSKRIAPGAYTTIHLELKLNNDFQEVSKNVYFYTNDSTQEKHILVLKANVNTGYTLSPEKIIFYNVEAGVEATINLTITNTSTSPITIDSVEVLMSPFKISGIAQCSVIPAQSSISCLVSYTPTEAGKFYSRIILHADKHPMFEKIQIWAWGLAK